MRRSKLRAWNLWLLLAVLLATCPIGSRELRAETAAYATISGLRADVARRLKNVAGIQKVSLNPRDRAIIFVTVNNDRVKRIEVDVTNLYGRIQNLPSSKREAEVRRFVHTVSTHLLTNI